jgi:hypothetical protein
MALMAAEGEIIPMPCAAVFADTQEEPAAVYRWLDKLEPLLPFPIIRVSKGRLSRARKPLVPAFVKTAENTPASLMPRQCTTDYKVIPILKAITGLLKAHKAERAYQWIGISLEEAHRMKPAYRNPRVINRWPLIELELKRYQCVNWLKEHGYPEPAKSACVFCPYRNDTEWRRLKSNDPIAFARAVAFDKQYRNVSLRTTPGAKAYVHRSLVPLEQVDFSTDYDRGQLSLFGNECEGLCGV